MQTFVIILSSIIVVLVIAIIIVYIRDKKETTNNSIVPKKLSPATIGKRVDTVSSLTPGQYMGDGSKLLSKDGKSSLYIKDGNLNFMKSDGSVTTIPNRSYVVCRLDGIYILDGDYKVTFSYTPTLKLVSDSENVRTFSAPGISTIGGLKINVQDNELFLF